MTQDSKDFLLKCVAEAKKLQYTDQKKSEELLRFVVKEMVIESMLALKLRKKLKLYER